MRAIVVDEFGPPERLRVGEVAEPVPGAGRGAGEGACRAASITSTCWWSAARTSFCRRCPFIPGKGPAGVVAALGAGVTGLRVGDRVLAMAEQGGYAEAVAVRRRPVLPIAAVDVVRRSRVAEPGLRHRLVRAARARAGWSLARLCWCSAPRAGSGRRRFSWPMRWVRGCSAGIPRPERAASVRAAGADAVIDLSAADLRDSLRAQVYAATEGRGADIILDPLGGDDIRGGGARARLARPAGGDRLCRGRAFRRIRTNYLLLKNIEISGLQISDYRKRRPAQVAACFAEIFGLYEQGKIKPAAATAFPLARAGEALAAVRDRRMAGRAVLQPREI